MSTRSASRRAEARAPVALVGIAAGIFALWKPGEAAAAAIWVIGRADQVITAIAASSAVHRLVVGYFSLCETLGRWMLSGFMKG